MKNHFTFLKSFRLLLVLAGLALSTTAMAQNYTINTLQASGNQTVKRNQAMRSANGMYSLLMQNDGNLCIYKDGPNFVWGTMTQGKDGAMLRMQADGNLCLYTNQGAHVWSTNTFSGGPDKTGSRLVLEDNGTLVLYNAAGAPIWNNTRGRLY